MVTINQKKQMIQDELVEHFRICLSKTGGTFTIMSYYNSSFRLDYNGISYHIISGYTAGNLPSIIFYIWTIGDEDSTKQDFLFWRTRDNLWHYNYTQDKPESTTVICDDKLNNVLDQLIGMFDASRTSLEKANQKDKVDKKDDQPDEKNYPDDNSSDRVGFLDDLKEMEAQKERNFIAEHERRVAKLVDSTRQPNESLTPGQRQEDEFDQKQLSLSIYQTLQDQGLINCDWQNARAAITLLQDPVQKHVLYCLNQKGKQRFYRILSRNQIEREGMLRSWIEQITTLNPEKGLNLKRDVQDCIEDYGRDLVKTWWTEYCNQCDIDF